MTKFEELTDIISHNKNKDKKLAKKIFDDDKEIAKISSEESFEFDENGLKTYLKQVITEIKKERE